MATDDLYSYIGEVLYDVDDNKIGSIIDLYVDDEGEEPRWFTVESDSLGKLRHFVPIDGIRAHEDGLMAPYVKQVILSSPQVDADDELSPEDEAELYDHYDLESGAREGFDYDGELGMTHSEEDLETGRSLREAGRAGLRRYIVTENVQIEVPVQKEVWVADDPMVDDKMVDDMQSPYDPDEKEIS
jgi:hypothetical protein